MFRLSQLGRALRRRPCRSSLWLDPRAVVTSSPLLHGCSARRKDAPVARSYPVQMLAYVPVAARCGDDNYAAARGRRIDVLGVVAGKKIGAARVSLGARAMGKLRVEESLFVFVAEFSLSWCLSSSSLRASSCAVCDSLILSSVL